MSAVEQNLETVLEKIAIAERQADRQAGSARLIVVSKTFSVEEIRPLLVKGWRRFGENRVQEAQSKWPRLRQEFPDIELHLIGPLQTNKSAEAVALFDVIHTVDRDRIAGFIADEMARQNKRLGLRIQVNTGLEPQKAGIDPRQTVEFANHCATQFGLTISGLMCIPPADENPGPHFALLNKLGKELALAELSMGMSGDYETAIAFGATEIRVGSAIFGSRTL